MRPLKIMHKWTSDEATYEVPNVGNQNFWRDYTESINKILCRKLVFFYWSSLTSVLRKAWTELTNFSTGLNETLKHNINHKWSETSIMGLKLSDVAHLTGQKQMMKSSVPNCGCRNEPWTLVCRTNATADSCDIRHQLAMKWPKWIEWSAA